MISSVIEQEINTPVNFERKVLEHKHVQYSDKDKHALGFLKLLDPTTNQFCFRTFDDVKIEIDGNFKNRSDLSLCSKTNSTLKEALTKLRHLNSKGAGVYVVINAGGQTTEDITRVRALFADTDGAPLEPLLVLKPHMVVKSSEGKWHVYWLVDNCELDKFTAIQTAIAHKYGTDPSIKDLPRVMRLAGFNHNKYGAYPSTIITYNPNLPIYKVNEVLSGLGLEINHSTNTLSGFQGTSEVAKLGSLFKFPLERLGSDGNATVEPYPFTSENACDVLSAAKVVHPNIQSEGECMDWGFTCVNLFELDMWPEDEARRLFDEICHLAPNAKTTLNDSKWESFKKQAKVYTGRPKRIATLLRRAYELGWKPKIQAQENPEWLQTMNENLFVAPYSNTVAVFRKQDDVYIPLRSEAFKLLYSNKTVEVQSSIGSKRTPIADAWLKHQNRREYSGVGFWPAVNAPSGKFNKWQGWNVLPNYGNVSPALNHIKKVICNNDQSLYAFVIGWLANCVQHPNEQGHVALVIMGGRGTGKTMFAEWIKSIFGRHSMSIANSKLLTGDFTGHLEELVFLVAEEAFWAGDKAAENSLKHAITGSTLTVHHKGFAPYDAPNYLHVIMTSNEEWVIPAGVDERRFAVCTVSDIHKGDVEYFKNLALWASNGGISALLEYLLNYDLTGFNVRTPPDTEGLRNQKMMSLDPTTRWIIHRLEVGAFVGNEWKQDVSANAMVNSLCEHQQLNTHERRRAETLLGSTLRKIFKGLKKIRQRNGNTRETLYRIPVTNINEARELFEKFMGIDGWCWGDDE